jgi:hypothetical protein
MIALVEKSDQVFADLDWLMATGAPKDESASTGRVVATMIRAERLQL